MHKRRSAAYGVCRTLPQSWEFTAMSRSDPPKSNRPASETREPLEGWKQIAAYLKRDVRTVQRWERTEQFPVRRQMHRKLGSVLAFKDELDCWMSQRCSL